MSKKIQRLAKKLVELSDHTSEKEIIQTLIVALDSKLESYNGEKDKKIVLNLQRIVEKHYGLKKGGLTNSFKHKDRELTEAKFMWVIISLHVFLDDRKKVQRLISNGITRQKVYTCKRTFDELNEKLPHEKKLKQTYKQIIQSYE